MSVSSFSTASTSFSSGSSSGSSPSSSYSDYAATAPTTTRPTMIQPTTIQPTTTQPTTIQPTTDKGKNTADHNEAMREIVKSWGSVRKFPPSCHHVAYSRWRRFNASNVSTKPKGELLASVLCADSGTTADFNPPLLERTYLRAEQPEPFLSRKPQLEPFLSCKPQHKRHRVPRKPAALRNTGSTCSSVEESDKRNVSTIVFEKQPDFD